MKLEIKTPSYNYYSNKETNLLVAVERSLSKSIGKAFKKYKKATLIPDTETVVGYNFIVDETYNTLKIDFEKELIFKIKDLEKAAIT